MSTSPTQPPTPSEAPPRPLGALAVPSFVALWLGSLSSNAGSWMHTFASRLLMYDLTKDPLWLGLDAFAQGVSTVLLPFGGVLADRFDRRTILIVGNVLAAINVALLAVSSYFEFLDKWHILAISFLNGTINASIVPANQSLVPSIVGKANLSSALALNSMQFNISRVLGPVLAAVAYKGLGPHWCFAINSATFLVLAGVLTGIKVKPRPVRKHQPALQAMASGWRYIRGRPDLMMIIVLVGAGAFLSAPAMSMAPALAAEIYFGGGDEVARLIACFGGGAVVGAYVLAVHGHEPKPWRTFGTLLILGTAQLALSYADDLAHIAGLDDAQFLIALAFMFVMGMMMVGSMVRLGSALQHGTPDSYRGRVLSFQQLAFRASQPLGSLVAGAIASVAGFAGVIYSFRIFGAVLIGVVIALWFVRRAGNVTYQLVVDDTDEGEPAE